MLRWLVLILLVANGVFYAWTQGWLDEVVGLKASGGREPERLSRQVNTDAITVMPASPPAGGGGGTACLETAPLSEQELARAETALREAAVDEDQWRRQAITRPGSYIVYMGRFPEPDLMQRKQAELQRLRITFEPVQGLPELEPGLSLGRYDNEAAAEAALAQFSQRGVRTARVARLSAPATLQQLRVPAAPAVFARPLQAAGFKPCAAAG